METHPLIRAVDTPSWLTMRCQACEVKRRSSPQGDGRAPAAPVALQSSHRAISAAKFLPHRLRILGMDSRPRSPNMFVWSCNDLCTSRIRSCQRANAEPSSGTVARLLSRPADADAIRPTHRPLPAPSCAACRSSP